MKRVIEFRQGDKTLLVEVEGEAPRGDQLSSRGDQLSSRGGTIEKAKQSFEEALADIVPFAGAILRQVTALAPEAVSVELGFKFNAEARVILASSAVEGNCKVTLNWKPKPSTG